MNRTSYILLKLLLILFSNFLYCAAHDVTCSASILNNSPAGIQIFNTSSGSYAVTSFEFISENRIAFLCGSEKKIKIYETLTSQLISEFSLDYYPEDFTYGYNRYFILSDYSVHQLDETGKEQTQFKISEEFKFIERLKLIDNSLFALTSEGDSYKIIDNGTPIEPEKQRDYFVPGWLVNKDVSVNSVKNDNSKFTLNIYKNGRATKEEKINVDKKLGSAVIIGASDDIIYIDVQFILEDVPLKTERSIFAYSLNNEDIIDIIEVPENYQYYSKHDFVIFNNNLVKIISSQVKTDIIKFSYNINISKTVFPKQYIRDYHYNYYLPNIEKDIEINGIIPKPNDIQSITRSQIMTNADKYEKVKWHCAENNTSNNTIVYLPDGGIIRTPAWVVVGDKVKMPYKWGGFTHIDNFNTRINAGSFAGSDYTSREQNVVSAGDTYCVGVDCSGFVSLVWGRTQREWTGSLPNISTQLQSWSQVQPGDIANKSGSHTMLFVSSNPSGTFNIIHASGSDWRVSYKTVNLVDLSGYTPLKYKNVEEITSVNTDKTMADNFALLQNYPNPFNPTTKIQYAVGSGSAGNNSQSSEQLVTLKVYDILGNEVATLVNEHKAPGYYEVEFNSGIYNLSSGIYFYQLKSGNYKSIKKLVLLK